MEQLLKIEDDDEFKLQTGVRKEVFFKMLSILNDKYKEIRKNGGNKGIGPACKLVIALLYWREYRCMRQMAFDFDIALSTTCDSITWVEDTLSESELFNFQGIKEELLKYEKLYGDIDFIIGDVTEQPIEIPEDNQEEYYSGKKKRHTLKNQIIIVGKNKRIINVFNSKGTTHDFQMLKNSNILKTLEMKLIKGLFDSGYQGIKKFLTNACIPYKKSKNHELTEDEKKYNTELSKNRIEIEHVNREIKKFRIMKDVYRSHRDRYQLRLFIVCGIYNLNYC